MRVYGIASAISGDIDDFYATREEAEAALTEVLRHEPSFAGIAWVAEVEVEEPSRN